LQFDVVAYRLRSEYGVDCAFEGVPVATARWVHAADAGRLREFERKAHEHLARDHSDCLVYIAPSRVNLNLTEERWPDISFRPTREQIVA
jgi:peptide chain release factor 3